jgi:hypothetical protein
MTGSLRSSGASWCHQRKTNDYGENAEQADVQQS